MNDPNPPAGRLASPPPWLGLVWELLSLVVALWTIARQLLDLARVARAKPVSKEHA